MRLTLEKSIKFPIFGLKTIVWIFENTKVDKVQIICIYFIPWRLFDRDLLNDSLLFGNHIDSSGKILTSQEKKIELREKREKENNCSLMSSLSLFSAADFLWFYAHFLSTYLFLRCCFSALSLYNVGLKELYSTHFPLIQFGFESIKSYFKISNYSVLKTKWNSTFNWKCWNMSRFREEKRREEKRERENNLII